MPNKEIPAAIRKQLEDHENRIIQLEALYQAKPQASGKKVPIKEFLFSKNPLSDVDKTLVIGCYLEKYEGFSCFNVKDIESGFRSAKEPVPGNINDNINKNISKKCLMEADQKKDNKRAWVLTNLGEQRVEKGFEKKQ